MDTTHLTALYTRLSNEKSRYATDNSAHRAVWIKQIEKEIANERAFLGMPADEPMPEMTDDEILAALEM